MESYIVRVYRLRKKDPRKLVGIVEHVGAQGKMGFTNYDELWDIITLRRRTYLQKAWRERQTREAGVKKAVKNELLPRRRIKSG